MSFVPSAATPSARHYGSVADQAFVVDLDPNGVEENQRIARFERPVLRFLGDRLDHGSVTVEMRSGDTSSPRGSRRWPWISRTVMPRAYIDTILLVEAGKPPLEAWYQLRIGKCPPDCADAGCRASWPSPSGPSSLKSR